MRSTPRSAKVVALLAGTALIAAACGSSKGSSSDTTGAAASSEAPTTEAGASTSAGETGSSTAPAAGGMTLTIKLNPDAVWDDGTPITSADLECTCKATLEHAWLAEHDWATTRSTSIDASDPQTVGRQVLGAVRGLQEPVLRRSHRHHQEGRRRQLRRRLRRAADSGPVLGPAVQAWSPGARTRRCSSPTTSTGSRTTSPSRAAVVMVPKADSDTEINSLKSGEVDMIFPQAFAGITDALNDPNIKYTPGYGTNYEDLYFQQSTAVVVQGRRLPPGLLHVGRPRPDPEDHLRPDLPGLPSCCNCGLWVPTIGKWCDNDRSSPDSYDPAGAEKHPHRRRLDEGRRRHLGQPDGNVPTIRWMVNTGNKRREDTQALMIPDFAASRLQRRRRQLRRRSRLPEAAASPRLRPGHVHQHGRPGPDGHVDHVVRPDPVGREQQPGPEHHRLVQRGSLEADDRVGPDRRRDQARSTRSTRSASTSSTTQSCCRLPVPEHRRLADRQGRWPGRPGRGQLHERFKNINKWEPQWRQRHRHRCRAVAGLPQPGHRVRQLLVVVWTTAFPVLPSVWDTTADGYEITPLVTEEPTVELG